jgi:pimeloyl-ACP methyl ester carboxylesterase
MGAEDGPGRHSLRGIEHGPVDAPLVVLIHGAPDRGRSFYAAARSLGDLRVLVYDRRGYGASVAVPPAATSLADHASDVIDLLAGRRATLVGHSFGSNVAILAAIREPSVVASLGLWEPPLAWFDWWPAWARKVIADIAGHPDPAKVGERAFKVVAGREAWERLPEAGRDLCRAEGHAFSVDTASQLSPPFALADVKVPSLVGYGTKTWEHQIDGARRLAAVLGARLVALDGADHFAHAAQPEAFAGFVRQAVLAREASTGEGGWVG